MNTLHSKIVAEQPNDKRRRSSLLQILTGTELIKDVPAPEITVSSPVNEPTLFGKTTFLKQMVNSSFQTVEHTLKVSGHKGFVFEDHWVCYRRNYMNISVVLDIAELPSLLENGLLQSITGFSIALKARNNRNGVSIELIQQARSREKSLQTSVQPKTCVFMNGKMQTMHFERVQFKNSTRGKYSELNANVLVLELYAHTATSKTLVAESVSKPVEVRCKSSKFYSGETDEFGSLLDSVLSSAISPGLSETFTSPMLIQDSLLTPDLQFMFKSPGSNSFLHLESNFMNLESNFIQLPTASNIEPAYSKETLDVLNQLNIFY